MTRPSELDWSDPNRTPRFDPSKASACREGVSPPVQAPSRPLTFWFRGGEILFCDETSTIHPVNIIRARHVRNQLEDDVRFVPWNLRPAYCAIVAELKEAINSARRWRQAQGGL